MKMKIVKLGLAAMVLLLTSIVLTGCPKQTTTDPAALEQAVAETKAAVEQKKAQIEDLQDRGLLLPDGDAKLVELEALVAQAESAAARGELETALKLYQKALALAEDIIYKYQVPKKMSLSYSRALL